MNDKKNSLFAVFDGHGGTQGVMQEPKSLPSSRGTSFLSWRPISTSKAKTTKKHSAKHSFTSTSCLPLRQANQRSAASRRRCVIKATDPTTKKSRMLGVLPTWSLSLPSIYTAPMQGIQGQSDVV